MKMSSQKLWKSRTSEEAEEAVLSPDKDIVFSDVQFSRCYDTPVLLVRTKEYRFKLRGNNQYFTTI